MFRTHKDTVRTRVPAKVNKDVPLQYFCEFCDDSSDTLSWSLEPDLEIHRRSVHKAELLLLLSDPNSFMCSVCLHKQVDRDSLITHIKTNHLLSPPHATRVKREVFICDYCNKIFFNKQLLAVHIQSLHLLSNLEKKRAMALCPYCFHDTPIKSIWFHFLSHGIINTASCPICISSYDNTFEVLEHVESHPGFYKCIICPFETNKETLFLNHIQKHKKPVNLEEKGDVSCVERYFVPQKKPFVWSSKVPNIFQGIKLAPEIKICILCQEMCLTDEEMLNHIYGDHSPNSTIEVKRYWCICGEEFTNNILLKHHIFLLKGEHKVFNGTQPELAELLATKDMQQLSYGEAIEDTYKMVCAMDNDTNEIKNKSSNENESLPAHNRSNTNIEPNNAVLNVNYETMNKGNAGSSSYTGKIKCELGMSPGEIRYHQDQSGNKNLVTNKTSDIVHEMDTGTNSKHVLNAETINITSESKSNIYKSILEEFDDESFESTSGIPHSGDTHDTIAQNGQNAILINNDLTNGYYKQLMVIEDVQLIDDTSLCHQSGSAGHMQYLPEQHVVLVQVDTDEQPEQVDIGGSRSVAVEDSANFFSVSPGAHADYSDGEDCNAVTVEDTGDDVLDKEPYMII